MCIRDRTSTNKKAQTISNAVINGTTAYTVEFAEEYYSDLKLNANTTDDFGRPCVEWFWKADSIGVYSNSDDLVATYTKKVTATDIYEAVGKSVSNAVKSGDAKCWITLDGKYIEAELNKVCLLYTSYWEVSLLHTKPLGDIPEELLPERKKTARET